MLSAIGAIVLFSGTCSIIFIIAIAIITKIQEFNEKCSQSEAEQELSESNLDLTETYNILIDKELTKISFQRFKIAYELNSERWTIYSNLIGLYPIVGYEVDEIKFLRFKFSYEDYLLFYMWYKDHQELEKKKKEYEDLKVFRDTFEKDLEAFRAENDKIQQEISKMITSKSVNTSLCNSSYDIYADYGYRR